MFVTNNASLFVAVYVLRISQSVYTVVFIGSAGSVIDCVHPLPYTTGAQKSDNQRILQATSTGYVLAATLLSTAV